MQFRKLKPIILFYRDYTKFSNKTFIKSLKVELVSQAFFLIKMDFGIFAKFTQRLNNNAQRKRKTIRGNQRKFPKLL